MRVRLEEDPGMIWTNGEIHGKDITLAEGMTKDGFYKITCEEYGQKFAELNNNERNY